MYTLYNTDGSVKSVNGVAQDNSSYGIDRTTGKPVGVGNDTISSASLKSSGSIQLPPPPPVALVNKVALKAIAVSPFIQDAKRRHKEWESKFAAGEHSKSNGNGNS